MTGKQGGPVAIETFRKGCEEVEGEEVGDKDSSDRTRTSRSTGGSLASRSRVRPDSARRGLWRTQREILTAVGQHSRVAVKACQLG